jgi:hypothetical protein
VTNAAKARGDAAEREVASQLSLLLGVEIRRKLGAGRRDDIGDLDGLDGWVGQVAYRPGDILRALIDKPAQCELQQARAGTPFGVTFLRQRGGIWRAVQTIPQFIEVYRALSD